MRSPRYGAFKMITHWYHAIISRRAAARDNRRYPPPPAGPLAELLEPRLLLSAIDWTTSQYFAPIGNQDGEGSCAAWAHTYYIKTFLEAREHNWDLSGATWTGGYTGNPSAAHQDLIFSPDFTYHQCNGGADNGSSFDGNHEVTRNVGAATWDLVDYDPGNSTAWPPDNGWSEEAWRQAAVYRDSSAARTMDFSDPAGLNTLKAHLDGGNLVKITVRVGSTNYIDEMTTLDNYNPNEDGRHAVTIAGYDDNRSYTEGGTPTTGAVKIANSWGSTWNGETDSDGCYWMSYACLMNNICHGEWFENRVGYEPELVAAFDIDHPDRGETRVTLGSGDPASPDATRTFDSPEYAGDGDDAYPGGNIVLDISDLVYDLSTSNQFFITVTDNAGSDTGTLQSFSVEYFSEYLTDYAGTADATAVNSTTATLDNNTVTRSVTLDTTPDAADDAGTTTEDAGVDIDILVNDNTWMDTGDLGITLHADADGTVSDNGDGTVHYDPDGQFEHLAAGNTATDTFTYTITDENGGTGSATVTITINGANDAPAAAGDTGATDEGSVLSAPAAGVLTNDTDPDTGDTLTVTALNGNTGDVGAPVSLGSGGRLTLNANGSYTYDPHGQFEDLAVGETATDTFAYTVSDGNETDTATVTVTIHGLNDPPTAVDDDYTAAPDAPYEDIPFDMDVLANDSDPDTTDNTNLLVGSWTDPAHGTVTLNPDGTLHYVPDAEYNGSDNFTYTVSDGHGATDTAAVSLQVQYVNDEPDFDATDPAAVFEDSGSHTIAGWAAFDQSIVDPDAAQDDPVSTEKEAVQDVDHYMVANVVNGVLLSAGPTIAGDGTLSFETAPDANGEVTFDVRVQDGGGTPTAYCHDTGAYRTFTITILPVNDKPDLAAADPPAVNEDAGPQTVAGWATFNAGPANEEAAQGVLSYTVSNVSNTELFAVPPAVAGDGTLTYTPMLDKYTDPAGVTFDVRVRDDGGTPNGGDDTGPRHTFTITINPVNDAPVATGPATVDHTIGQAVTIALEASDVETLPADLAAYTIKAPPAHGTLVQIDHGLYRYEAVPGWCADDTFSFSATDDGATSAGAGPMLESNTYTVSLNYLEPEAINAENGRAEYIDADGDMVTVVLTGSGAFTVYRLPDENDWGDAVMIAATGTDAASRLYILPSTATTSLQPTPATAVEDITADGPLFMISAPATDLTGDLTIDGPLAVLTMNDVTGIDHSDIAINDDRLPVGPTDTLSVNLGAVRDASLATHDLPVKQLVVDEWLDTSHVIADTLTAPSINGLYATGRADDPRTPANESLYGEFEADLLFTGRDIYGYSLITAQIAGPLGGTWDLTDPACGTVGTVIAGSTAAGWSLNAPHSYVNYIATYGTMNGAAMTADYYGTIWSRGNLGIPQITALGANPGHGYSIIKFYAGDVSDVSVDSPGGVYTVYVNQWLDTVPAADTITAGWIGGIYTKTGDFGAGLAVTGRDAKGYALGKASIAGELSGTWDLTATTGMTGKVVAGSTGETWELDAPNSCVTYIATYGDMDAAAMTADYYGTLYAVGTLKAPLITALGGDPVYDVSIMKLYAGSVRDVSINAAGGLYLTNVGDWIDTDATPDTIDAAWATKFYVTGPGGDFHPDVTLDGTNALNGYTLFSGYVAGNLGRQAGPGSAWNITGEVGTFSVIKAAYNSRVQATGSIAKVSVGAAIGSDFLAGVKAGFADRFAGELTDYLNDGAGNTAQIGAVLVNGWRGAPAVLLEDSNFTAARLGPVYLRDYDAEDTYRLTVLNTEDNFTYVRYTDSDNPAANWQWWAGTAKPAPLTSGAGTQLSVVS